MTPGTRLDETKKSFTTILIFEIKIRIDKVMLDIDFFLNWFDVNFKLKSTSFTGNQILGFVHLWNIRTD